MNKQTEQQQWQICNWCGAVMVPHPKLTDVPQINPWLVCPKDLEYYAAPLSPERHLRKKCTPPPVLAAPFVHGAYYRGSCRNASIARYNAETDKFVYMRGKFGCVYPEDIRHAGCDDGFDLFEPFAIVENPPFEIPLVA
jgi:hypothetical protein